MAATTLSSTAEPPFALAHQLTSSHRALSGHPWTLAHNRSTVLDLLDREFCSWELDRVAPKLWWMSKQDSASISPLHRQAVKRRTVVVTEDPKLHLVWIYDRIFIKPLPHYIVSFDFWKCYLSSNSLRSAHTKPQQSRIRRAVLGYLRTYIYLIQYESDFRMAQNTGLCLIPSNITWEQFCNFASDLSRISNEDVSERYLYGEIRLTRLNFYAPLLLHKSHFQRVEYQYGTYFSRFYAPLLFLIGVVSIILSGLQVALAAEQVSSERINNLLVDIALWFSVAMVTYFCAVLLYLCILWSYKVVKEWKFAVRDRLRLLEEGRAKGKA